MSGNFQYDCQVSIYSDRDQDDDGGYDDEDGGGGCGGYDDGGDDCAKEVS